MLYNREAIAEFWNKFDQEWDLRNRSTIIVLGDGSLQLSDYKVYINQNIYGTGAKFAHLAPPNSVYVRLRAGAYCVVVREHDVMKPNRLKSTPLQVEIHDDEQIMIRATLNEGQLLLTLAIATN
ncbi:hypothetical protein NDA01_20055 [Trichocoleus desertorum AS-A10]|uniref:hypothetical protein n=1 Tax=Trichocoleus desertorum TaxID=1481672 RepID=UPI00329936B2